MLIHYRLAPRAIPSGDIDYEFGSPSISQVDYGIWR